MSPRIQDPVPSPILFFFFEILKKVKNNKRETTHIAKYGTFFYQHEQRRPRRDLRLETTRWGGRVAGGEERPSS